MKQVTKVASLILAFAVIVSHASCMEHKKRKFSPFDGLCADVVREICDHLSNHELLLQLQLVNKATREYVKTYVSSPNSYERTIVVDDSNVIDGSNAFFLQKFLKNFQGRLKIICIGRNRGIGLSRVLLEVLETLCIQDLKLDTCKIDTQVLFALSGKKHLRFLTLSNFRLFCMNKWKEVRKKFKNLKLESLTLAESFDVVTWDEMLEFSRCFPDTLKKIRTNRITGLENFKHLKNICELDLCDINLNWVDSASLHSASFMQCIFAIPNLKRLHISVSNATGEPFGFLAETILDCPLTNLDEVKKGIEEGIKGLQKKGVVCTFEWNVD